MKYCNGKIIGSSTAAKEKRRKAKRQLAARRGILSGRAAWQRLYKAASMAAEHGRQEQVPDGGIYRRKAQYHMRNENVGINQRQ